MSFWGVLSMFAFLSWLTFLVAFERESSAWGGEVSSGFRRL